MTSTYTKACLTLAVFCLSSIAAAQSPAKEPNAVPAATVKPAPAPAESPEVAALPAVRVAMPAPALKVAKWFRGAPLERLEPNNVYVVEFWATWCGPCRVSIPHLTELAHKHAGKATVIGVSVWERPKEKTNEAIFALVEPFVTNMGDKMDYRVAADGIDWVMATTWMQAAGKNSIPTAFVIGRDGKVAWIGHPFEMDKVLEEVIAGTFDVQAEAKRQEAEWRDQQERDKLEAPIRAALAAKDNKAVVEAIDKALAAKPDMEAELMPVKFDALVQSDETAAFAYLKVLLEKGSFEKEPYHAFNAAAIVNHYAATLKNPDYALLLAAMEQAKAAEQDNPSVLVFYAEVLSRVGKIDRAIEAQQKAIEQAEPLVGPRLPQEWLDAQKARLEEYKAKKK